MRAEAADELLARRPPELANRADAQRFEPGCRLLADTPDAADWQRVEDGLLPLLRDDDEAVRLLEIRGQFREEFIRRDADRGDEARLFADLRLELLGISARRLHQELHARDIEKRLVDGQRLDNGRVARKDREDRLRHRAVMRVVAFDKDALRAEPLRPHDWHRRVHAEPPRLVGAGRDDTAPGKPADNQRLPAILLMIALLN